MYAKHLIAAGFRKAAAGGHVPSDVGQYLRAVANGAIVRTTYDLDRSAGTLYCSLDNPAYLLATPGSDGNVLLGDSSRTDVRLFATDASGPTSVVGTYGKPGGTIWHLYGRGACSYVQSGSTYALTHVDLATGQAYAQGTVSRLEAWLSGDDLFVGAAQVSALTGQATGSGRTFFTQIAASAGRHARASIPRQMHEDAPPAVFLRMRAAAAPEAVTWSPFDRPITADTRVRGYVLNPNGGYPGFRQPRRKASVAPHQVYVRQVEISPSAGTTVLDGQPVSRHTLTSYTTSLTGFMLVSKADGVRMVVTSRGEAAVTYAVLQYLDGGGQPTGEFVMESQGVWNYTDGAFARSGIAGTPRFAMAERLVLDLGNGFLFADYEGKELSRESYPVVNGASTSNVVALPNADALVVPGNRYASSAYSVDYGKTWLPLTLWGARGTTKPTQPGPAVNDLLNGASMMPLFVT